MEDLQSAIHATNASQEKEDDLNFMVTMCMKWAHQERAYLLRLVCFSISIIPPALFCVSIRYEERSSGSRYKGLMAMAALRCVLLFC
jgi:hypothetical protein